MRRRATAAQLGERLHLRDAPGGRVANTGIDDLARSHQIIEFLASLSGCVVKSQACRYSRSMRSVPSCRRLCSTECAAGSAGDCCLNWDCPAHVPSWSWWQSPRDCACLAGTRPADAQKPRRCSSPRCPRSYRRGRCRAQRYGATQSHRLQPQSLPKSHGAQREWRDAQSGTAQQAIVVVCSHLSPPISGGNIVPVQPR